MLNNMLKKFKLFALLQLVLLATLLFFSGTSFATSASKIDADVNKTLQLFQSKVEGSAAYMKGAKGILVFPKVYGAGIGIGGEYGKGALRIGGRSAAYYNIISGSIGFQLGAQRKAIIIMFMDPDALNQFKRSEGFKIGADAGVTIVDTGLAKNFDSQTLRNPILGFVLDQKGLMYKLTLDGAKITQIHPD